MLRYVPLLRGVWEDANFCCSQGGIDGGQYIMVHGIRLIGWEMDSPGRN
jgi:hypothetical protein